FTVRVDEVEHLVLPIHVPEAWLEDRFEDHRTAITRPVIAERLPEAVRAWLNQRFRVAVVDGDGQRGFCLATLGNPVTMADEYEAFEEKLAPPDARPTSRRLVVAPPVAIAPGVSYSRAECAMRAEPPEPTSLQPVDVPLCTVEAEF